MSNILSLISVELVSDGKQIGSGCLIWSEDHSKLYCITASHCINDYDRIQIKNETVSFQNTNLVIDDTDKDIAVIIINDETNSVDIPNVYTYDCENIPCDDVIICGYPLSIEGKQVEILGKLIPHDMDNLSINIESLDAYACSRMDEVNGISGGGCFIKSGTSYKFIGIENKAVSYDVPFKNLNCIMFHVINDVIESKGLPSLPRSTPQYITDRRLKFTDTAKDALASSFKNKWCETVLYNVISKRIEFFLNDTSQESSTIFIGGLSGSGKTRSVLEAVKDRISFIYYSYTDDFNNDMTEIKKYPEKVYIIVDEASLEEYEAISSCFRNQGFKCKIIVIGCTPQNPDYGYNNNNVLFLDRLTKEDTITVIKAAYPHFEDDTCNAIYDLSLNDLRLAIMIADIYDKDQTRDISEIPAIHIRDNYNSASSILNKMLGLNIEEKPHDIDLQTYFYHLSLFIDIGYKNEFESELKDLAAFFNINYSDYRRAIDYFECIQLGIKKGDYFEESPRALAKYAFDQQAYSMVRHNLEGFMSSIKSQTLRTRFIKRAMECGKKEVEEELSSWFRIKYSQINISDSSFSERELMMLTEFFPEVGLAIIKNYLLSENTNIEEFGCDCTSKLRRHIIWTCDHLANFAQYFYKCEEILFILAQNETETYLSNNSQGTWCGFFSILLASSEISFVERYDLLLKRARKAESSDSILFEMAFNMAFNDRTSRIVPPRIIGNRITPICWNPQNHNEYIEAKKYALDKAVESVELFIPEIRDSICKALFDSFQSFLWCELLEEYKSAANKIISNRSQKNELIVILDENIRYQEEDKTLGEETMAIMKKWMDELTETDLEGRINAFLTRDIYTYGYTDEDDKKKNKLISELANEFMHLSDREDKMCNIIRHLGFRDEPMFEFGKQIAMCDDKLTLLHFVTELLDISSNNSFSQGYYCGLFKSNGKHLPVEAVRYLDVIKIRDTSFALWVSTAFDQSINGVNRIIELIPHADRISPLINLQSKEWTDLLSTSNKKRIIGVILDCEKDLKYDIIFKLLDAWLSNEPEESALYEDFFSVFRNCIDLKANFNIYSVERILEKLPEIYQEDAIRIFVQLFEFDNYYNERNKAILKYINRVKTSNNEAMIFNALADRLLNIKQQFLSRAHPGIFNDYPLEIIVDWLNQDRINRPILLAYHLSMPNLVEPEFSELTQYMLTEYEDNDRVYQNFLIGNSNLITLVPENIYKTKDQWYALTEKYANSKHRRIKQWANDKRKEIEQMCDMYIRSEETYKRLT